MSKRKWGESFLKTGLPLEHLTQAILRKEGWDCSTVEYARPNRKGEETWFELDFSATYGTQYGTELSLLIECKYHDPSRFWFFLPHDIERWFFDDRFLNCAPFQTLAKPRGKKFMGLAPASARPIVVSEDGTKQDNAAYTAIQQLVNGYVPWSLSFMFSYLLAPDSLIDPNSPGVSALIPMIVTNAKIFRLRSEVSDLDKIREALAPTDIADELDWTWCYHDPPTPLTDQNMKMIVEHLDRENASIMRFSGVKERMVEFISRPNWIAVVNVKALSRVAKVLSNSFVALRKRNVSELVHRKGTNRRKRRNRKARK